MTRTVISELATPSEAAAELRVSAGTIKRWLRGGEIEGVRLPSGEWRVPLSSLRELRTHHRTRGHVARDVAVDQRRPA